MSPRDFDALSPMDASGGSRTDAGIGPSDTSDSINDLPEDMQLTDSDREGTGDRPAVDERIDISTADDVDVDRDVTEAEAGLAYSAPDPARNGGTPGEDMPDLIEPDELDSDDERADEP